MCASGGRIFGGERRVAGMTLLMSKSLLSEGELQRRGIGPWKKVDQEVKPVPPVVEIQAPVVEGIGIVRGGTWADFKSHRHCQAQISVAELHTKPHGALQVYITSTGMGRDQGRHDFVCCTKKVPRTCMPWKRHYHYIHRGQKARSKSWAT